MDNLGINTRTYADKNLTKIGHIGTKSEIDEMAEKLSGNGENKKQINTSEEEFMEALSKLTPEQQELINNTNLTGAEADSFRDGAYRSFSDEDFANIRNAMELKSNITAQGLSDNAQIVSDENGNTSGFIIESDNIGLSDDVIRKAVTRTLDSIVQQNSANVTETLPETALEVEDKPQTPPTVPEKVSEVSTEDKTSQNTTTVENNTPQNVEQPPETNTQPVSPEPELEIPEAELKTQTQQTDDKADFRINVSPEEKEKLTKQANILNEEYEELSKSDKPEDKAKKIQVMKRLEEIAAKYDGFISDEARNAYYSEEKDNNNSLISQLREKYQDYFKESGINDENIQKQILLVAKCAYDKKIDMYSKYNFSFNEVIDASREASKQALLEEIKNVTGNEVNVNSDLLTDLENINENTINKLMENDYNFYHKIINEQLGYSEDETVQTLSEYKKNCSNLYGEFNNGKITQNEFINKYRELKFDIDSLKAKKQIDVKVEDNEFEITSKAILADGVIDLSHQQENGDCQALSILNAMSRTPWGAQAIKESIKYDDEGNVTITFRGATGENNKFNLTRDEIVNAQINGWAARGDADTAAIELALKEYSGLKPSDDLNPFTFKGGAEQIGEIYQLICGKDEVSKTSIPNEDLEKVIKEYGNNAAITCGFKGRIQQFVPAKYKEYFSTMHAYSVKGITQENGKEYVVVVNPWYSEDEIKINLKDFNDVAQGIQMITHKNKENS